jgi:hypothetical protein
MGTNRNLFYQNGHQKCGRVNICSVEESLSRIFEEFQRPAILTKIVQHFGGIFSSNKSAPANKKKGVYTKRVPKKPEVRGIFV